MGLFSEKTLNVHILDNIGLNGISMINCKFFYNSINQLNSRIRTA